MAADAVAEMGNFEHLEEFARFPFPVADIVEEGKDAKVFPDFEVHGEVGVGGGKVAALEDGGAVFFDIEAEKLDGSAGGGGESEEDVDGGGFAGAVGSEKSDDFAATNLEREAFQRGRIAELFVQTVDLDDGSGQWRDRIWRNHLADIVGADRVGGNGEG